MPTGRWAKTRVQRQSCRSCRWCRLGNEGVANVDGGRGWVGHRSGDAGADGHLNTRRAYINQSGRRPAAARPIPRTRDISAITATLAARRSPSADDGREDTAAYVLRYGISNQVEGGTARDGVLEAGACSRGSSSVRGGYSRGVGGDGGRLMVVDILLLRHVYGRW